VRSANKEDLGTSRGLSFEPPDHSTRKFFMRIARHTRLPKYNMQEKP